MASGGMLPDRDPPVRAEIVHQNIVVSSDGAVCLVDFALASPLAEIRPEFTDHAEIVGTLAYLAPEQTGRTGRWISGLTCTRWAQRCMSWPRASRRSGLGTRCG
jgi:serine/threonine protein kinase